MEDITVQLGNRSPSRYLSMVTAYLPIPFYLNELMTRSGESSYHTDYREHPLQKATIRTANKLPSAPVKFEGESSYRVEYKPMPPPEKKPVERNYLRQPVKIPFEATSSYNADFVKHPLNGRARAVRFLWITLRSTLFFRWKVGLRKWFPFPSPAQRRIVTHTPRNIDQWLRQNPDERRWFGSLYPTTGRQQTSMIMCHTK